MSGDLNAICMKMDLRIPKLILALNVGVSYGGGLK
jgi:hypothetical protein